MSEMASWFDFKNGQYSFLTDDDIIAYHDRMELNTRTIPWDDFVGHGGMMRVFNLKDNWTHEEGFIGMPLVIKKQILNGKMDMMFAHAGNLSEAGPEFMPLMKRLANRFPNVANQLKSNPYKDFKGNVDMKLSNFAQVKVGVDNAFKGSSIGKLLRMDTCMEDSMLYILKGATSYMDVHSDHHHYFELMNHPNLTRKVLEYISGNVKHKDVLDKAKELLVNFKDRKKVSLTKVVQNLKTKTVQKEGAILRATV